MKEEEKEKEKENEKISGWQLFYDDIFLLFMLGLAIPLVTFIIWGLMDIAGVPVAK
jgi:hypothetical protein